MQINFYGKSDVGCIRSNNEDTFVLQQIGDEKYLLAVVIDGCGGYEGGEYAAELAGCCILEHMQKPLQGDLTEQLREAMIYANNTIIDKQLPPYEKMCCVATAAFIDLTDVPTIYVAHVGDTRLYAYADGELCKLTSDHSQVGRMEEKGMLTEEEAMRHPFRNVITRSLGEKHLDAGASYVQMLTGEFEAPYTFLLCSDGLYDMLRSDEIAAVLGQEISTQDKVERLIAQAKEAGGKDNVTVLLIDIVKGISA